MDFASSDELPRWGQLPTEQYLIRHWDPSSPESADQQRARLIKEFLRLDPIPRDIWFTEYETAPADGGPRIPTEEEIANILRPWRSDLMRYRAWKLWQKGHDKENPVIIRTYYDPDDDERVESWANLSEEYEDVSHWSILDDPELFNFEGSDWRQVFYILPELSKLADGYARHRNWALHNEHQANFKKELNEVKRKYPTRWRSDLNLLVTENVETRPLLHYNSTTQVLIADKEAFQTDQFLLVLLDAKQNITMQARIDISEERLTLCSLDWFRRYTPTEMDEPGTIGEAFFVDGEPGKELYQWTKQYLEDDPISDVSGVTNDVSRSDV
ncbi:hypothetical protein ASPCAL02672 [Aspergillus calidoustus]|uniref:Uncharacterized protein n=1 Tax=Aspergillus calidoustus TaxID=454130 RepID=A0A0U5GT25_ASPCI|nr:hypothetical protein ASPCAL02672 [Aspergillus calidoustus]